MEPRVQNNIPGTNYIIHTMLKWRLGNKYIKPCVQNIKQIRHVQNIKQNRHTSHDKTVLAKDQSINKIQIHHDYNVRMKACDLPIDSAVYNVTQENLVTHIYNKDM